MSYDTKTVTLHDVEYVVSHDSDTGFITLLNGERMIGRWNTANLSPNPEPEVVETTPIIDADEPPETLALPAAPQEDS